MRSRRLRAVLSAIAANVRARRAALGLTQERTAESAGIAARFLQDIEYARTNMTVEVLVGLAVALQVEPAVLLAPAPKLAPAKPGRPRKQRASPTTNRSSPARS